jgi:phage protein D
MASDSSAEEIYIGRDFYVPYFEVMLQNKKLPKEIINDVISLSYKDSLTEMDSFELTINNWDAEHRWFKYIEGDNKEKFYPGQEVEVYMGYIYRGKKETERMLYGEITTLEPDFPGSGSPTLKVRGLNMLHRLRDKQRSDSYSKKRDSEIAKKIAGRINISIEVSENYTSAETPVDFIFQNNKYDIVFLIERAKTIGYELYFDPDKKKLIFKPSTQGKKAYKLDWNRSLLNFRPTLTTANQVSEVKVTGWDPDKKKKVVGTAKRKDLDTRPLSATKDIKLIEKSLTQKIEIVADRPVHNKEQAKKLAKETLERIAKGMVKASGSTVGLPSLRAGTYLEIGELGELFSGRYYVTETTHTISDSGYTTNFSARKEEENKG